MANEDKIELFDNRMGELIAGLERRRGDEILCVGEYRAHLNLVRIYVRNLLRDYK